MGYNTTTTLAQVQATLPTLQRIKELYQSATSLDQQRQARQTIRASKAGSSGKALCLVGGIGTFVVLDIIYRMIARSGHLTNLGAIIFIIFAFAASIYVYHFLKRRIQTKQETVNEGESEQINAQIEAISQEIYQITVENQSVIDVLPRDYRYYDAAAFFESALANGRADNMKEAVNLYEVHQHQLQMENNSRQMLYQQQMQSQMLSSIEASSRAAAVNSGIAATFSVLNFINRI